MADNILYYVSAKSREILRIAVPATFQQQVMMDYHIGYQAGYFYGPQIYKTLAFSEGVVRSIGMYQKALEYAKNCPQYAIVKGTGRKQKPPLHLISTEQPFQIVSVDIMELPLTTKGNKYYVVVFKI